MKRLALLILAAALAMPVFAAQNPPARARQQMARRAAPDTVRVELVLVLESGQPGTDAEVSVNALILSGGQSIETVRVGREWLVEWLGAQVDPPVTAAQLGALMEALVAEAQTRLIGAGR